MCLVFQRNNVLNNTEYEKMKKIIPLQLVLLLTAGCIPLRQESASSPAIHPKVFSLVTCSWSDTAEPIVTEINLDAVRKNGNQFNGKIFSEGGWTRINSSSGNGFMRYRIISHSAQVWRVEFQENTGGSLTSRCYIDFTIKHRTISLNNKQEEISVLEIKGIKEF